MPIRGESISRYNEDEMKKVKNIYKNVYADSSSKCVSARLLLRWKGSVYKIMTHHWVIWLGSYIILAIIYRNGLVAYGEERKESKMMFELMCFYAKKFNSVLPISFLVGFYVSNVVSRWWQQFQCLPWPDQLALKLANFVPGTDDIHHNLRKYIIRYVNLSNILVFRMVSPRVEKRFPDYESMVEAKLLLPHEAKILKGLDEKSQHETTGIPLLWATRLLNNAFEDKKINIESSFVIYDLQGSFMAMEAQNRAILNYGWMNFPLAYTQVVTFTVYFYFFSKLFSDQYLIPDKSLWSEHANVTNVSYVDSGPYINHTPNFVVPMFTLVEFFCYIGWMKVAAALLNPFGDDDEDFQMNYLIDRNLQVSYLIVDQASRDLKTINDHFYECSQHAEVVEKVMGHDQKDSTMVEKTFTAMDHAFDDFTEGISDNFKKLSGLSWRPGKSTPSPRPPKRENLNENNTTSVALEPMQPPKTFQSSYVNEISPE